MTQPARIVLIDDDSSNNILSKLSIKKVHPEMEVVAFTIPEEGLDYIANEYAGNPVNSILFLDINMPSLSGWEVLDKLEAIAEIVVPNFTIYMLSSSVDPSDKQKASNNPLVTGYLEKPLQREVLREMLGVI